MGYDPKVSQLLAGIATFIADEAKSLWLFAILFPHGTQNVQECPGGSAGAPQGARPELNLT